MTDANFYPPIVSPQQLDRSPGAKRRVKLMLVLGLLIVVGGGTWTGVTIYSTMQRDREISQLKTAVAGFDPVARRHNAAVSQNNAAVSKNQQAADQAGDASNAISAAHQALNGVLLAPDSDSTNCSTVSCLNATSKPGAEAFATFGGILRTMSVPPGSAATAKQLIADTTKTERDWFGMAEATSFDSFENDATTAETDGGHFDSDYQALITSIDNVSATLNNKRLQLNNTTMTLNHAATTLNQEGAALKRRAAALDVTIIVPTAN
jgi:hypothetical protein